MGDDLGRAGVRIGFGVSDESGGEFGMPVAGDLQAPCCAAVGLDLGELGGGEESGRVERVGGAEAFCGGVFVFGGFVVEAERVRRFGSGCPAWGRGWVLSVGFGGSEAVEKAHWPITTKDQRVFAYRIQNKT